jgi:uridine kinase
VSRPLVVVIAGGTASGKTTIATGLAASSDVLLISHDRYYRDAAEPASHNFDHPDALETSLLVQHVQALQAGEAVELPVYGFSGHRRAPHTDRVEPRPILLIEGILTLEHTDLAALADLRVYVRAPADVRLARRVNRDVEERGRELKQVLQRYLEMVRPMHDRFVAPTQERADLVMNGEGEPAALVADLRRVIDRRRAILSSETGASS